MAKVTGGLRALAKANLVPEDNYEFRVASVVTGMGDDNWEKAWCVIVNPEEPSLATRRIGYMLGSPDTGDWRGLTELLAAAELEDIPEGEYGEDDTRNLDGVTFPGRLFHAVGNRGLEARIRPTVSDEMMAYMASDEEDDEPKPRKKTAKKKRTRR